MGTNTFIGTPKSRQKPIWTLIYGQCVRQIFPISQLKKLTAVTRVCEGIDNNHVCLLGIKGEAYVASKPSHFIFFNKATQNVRSKPRPCKSYILKQTWCLSVCVFVTDIRRLWPGQPLRGVRRGATAFYTSSVDAWCSLGPNGAFSGPDGGAQGMMGGPNWLGQCT
jgi:hypothetical protein